MTTNIRSWLVYRYIPFNPMFNGKKEPAVAVRAVGKDESKTIDSLPSSVIRIEKVQAKSKSEAYRIGVQERGL